MTENASFLQLLKIIDSYSDLDPGKPILDVMRSRKDAISEVIAIDSITGGFKAASIIKNVNTILSALSSRAETWVTIASTHINIEGTDYICIKHETILEFGYKESDSLLVPLKLLEGIEINDYYLLHNILSSIGVQRAGEDIRKLLLRELEPIV